MVNARPTTLARITSILIVLVTALIARGQVQPSDATKSTEAGVRAWLTQIRNELRNEQRYDRRLVQFSAEPILNIGEAELSDMRQRVKGRPDHPDRHRLVLAEKSKRGQLSTTHRIWWRGANEWRLSNDHADNTGFSDSAVTVSTWWSLTPDGMSVVDPSEPHPPAVSYNQDGGWMRDVCDQFFLGGAHKLMFSDHDIAVAVTGAEVQLSSFDDRAPYKQRIIVKGAWDSGRQSFIPASLDVFRINDGSQPVFTIIYDKSAWSSDYMRFIPAGVTWLVENVPSQRYFNFSLSPAPDMPFDVATAVPSNAVNDPVRGRLSMRRITHHKGDHVRTVEVGSNNDEIAVVHERQAPGLSTNGLYNAIGWSALVVVIVCAIVMKRVMASRRRVV